MKTQLWPDCWRSSHVHRARSAHWHFTCGNLCKRRTERRSSCSFVRSLSLGGETLLLLQSCSHIFAMFEKYSHERRFLTKWPRANLGRVLFKLFPSLQGVPVAVSPSCHRATRQRHLEADVGAPLRGNRRGQRADLGSEGKLHLSWMGGCCQATSASQEAYCPARYGRHDCTRGGNLCVRVFACLQCIRKSWRPCLCKGMAGTFMTSMWGVSASCCGPNG